MKDDEDDEEAADLVLGELGGVVEVPVLGVRGLVAGGEGQAPGGGGGEEEERRRRRGEG